MKSLAPILNVMRVGPFFVLLECEAMSAHAKGGKYTFSFIYAVNTLS